MFWQITDRRKKKEKEKKFTIKKVEAHSKNS
jgi:hypothetical protein